MNKIIIFLLTFTIAQVLFLRHNLVYALDIGVNTKVKNIVNQAINQTQITFKDSNYTSSTNKFKGNETVFVKFETSASGNDQNEVWLLNSSKERIQRIALRRTGSGPYTYFGEFKLPNPTGQYYLSINLKGDNSSFSFEQNIEAIQETTNAVTASPSPEVFKFEVTPEEILSPIPTAKEEITHTKGNIIAVLINLINELIASINSFIKITPE